ncbi:uncharacterized protein LOC123429702 [Hordeum vulgare subsp. vulgare]|uniref:uncharacterized protein LOC123429702 n=1 Tax=Hordeum vulgare subsp. vulgare TaxID=112509 RepID=UPI001D1A4823|nr:uncharacterized protein LOC123429702 [Hordeum vulgare subsp. vulgare]
MEMQVSEPFPSPLLMVGASPSAGESAAVLHFSGEAPLHRHHGRPSAIASHLAAMALRSASRDPVTAPGRGEERRSSCTRRSVLPRLLVAGCTVGPASSVPRREEEDEPREGRERDKAGPTRQREKGSQPAPLVKLSGSVFSAFTLSFQ